MLTLNCMYDALPTRISPHPAFSHNQMLSKERGDMMNKGQRVKAKWAAFKKMDRKQGEDGCSFMRCVL